MKSGSNLESFEIVRISAGSVTTTMSVIPGKYVRFMRDHSAEQQRLMQKFRYFVNPAALRLYKQNRAHEKWSEPPIDTSPAAARLGLAVSKGQLHRRKREQRWER